MTGRQIISKQQINLLLRALSLAVRLVFFLFAASQLTDKEFGYFGIMFSVIGYATILLGFEFHTYSNRAVISADKQTARSLFTKSFSLYVLSLPLGSILIFGFYLLGYFEKSNLVLLTFILFLEYFSVQISRFLIILEEQVASTALLFIRSALWCISYVSFYFLGYLIVEIESILWFWFMGSTLSVVVGFITLSLKGYTFSRFEVDFSFLKMGVSTSAVMFLTATTYQGFFLFDRLILQNNLADDLFASYILFSSLFMTVVTLADAGFVAFFMPRLIKLFTADLANFQTTVQTFMWTLGLFSLMFTAALIVIVLAYLYATNDLSRDRVLVAVLCAVNAFAFAISIAPHTALYAMRKEAVSLQIQAFGLAIYLFGIGFLSHYFAFWIALMFPATVFLAIYWLKRRALFSEMNKSL